MNFRDLKAFVRLQTRSRTLAPKHPFGSKSHIYIHVGKTAGTSLSRLLTELDRQGHKVPLVLQHKWTLPMAIVRYPRARLAVVLRDPLERIVSGFNSRLRQNNASSPILWSHQEATAFSFFKDAGSFLDACMSDDDYQISAARFAAANIRHVSRGYAFHFVSPELVRREAGRFYCVGRISRMEDFTRRLLAPLGTSPEMAGGGIGQHNASARPSSSILDRYDEAQVARLRRFFAAEYEVYAALEALLEPAPAA